MSEINRHSFYSSISVLVFIALSSLLVLLLIKAFATNAQIYLLVYRFLTACISYSLYWKLVTLHILLVSFLIAKMNDKAKSFHELLVCIDQIDGSIEFFNYHEKRWHSSPISLELSTKQLLYDVQWLHNNSFLFAIGGRNVNNNPNNLMWSRNLNSPLSQWTLKKPLIKRRNNFSSVTFNDTIYVLGGNCKKSTSKDHILSSCESYDSQLDRWSTIDSLKIGRKNASAVIYGNCIYIAGGVNEHGTTERSVEKYDLQSETWSKIVPMTTARSHFALTLFANRLWAIGGMGGRRQALSSVESYDFKLRQWKKEESLKAKRIGHSATEFNGELYVVGGFYDIFKNAIGSYVSAPAQEVENYFLGKGWRKNSELQKSHPFAKLIIASNLNLKKLITGLEQHSFSPSNINNFDILRNQKKYADDCTPIVIKHSKVEVFNAINKKLFRSTSSMSFLRKKSYYPDNVNLLSFKSATKSAFMNETNYLLVCINKSDGAVQFYDHQKKRWHQSPVTVQLPVEQHEYQLELLGSTMYAIGGLLANDNQPTKKMWSRNLVVETDLRSFHQWTARADMSQERRGHNSVVLNELLYVLGGISNKQDRTLYGCERYDPKRGQWLKMANMRVGRAHAAAAVLSGQLYVAGGEGGKGGWERSVERYDPKVDNWRAVAPMSTDRSYFSLTAFEGRLWAIGGRGGNFRDLSRVESYDPLTDTWREEAPLKERRRYHAAIKFKGKLYVVGWCRDKESTVVEKYVPTTGWVEDSSLIKKCKNLQLLVIPPAYSSYFTTDSN